MSTRPRDALSLAILEAAGIPTKRVTGVRYEHDVNGLPVLTVDFVVRDADAGLVANLTQTYDITATARTEELA
jgi:hypothetical protein